MPRTHAQRKGLAPSRCLVPAKFVTPQTVRFLGVAINLSVLQSCITPPLDHSYLSKIFKGVRTPSIAYARQLAKGLGMELQPFLDGLETIEMADDFAEPQ